jgi:uncharacterized protein (TIGR03790 family)
MKFLPFTLSTLLCLASLQAELPSWDAAAQTVVVYNSEFPDSLALAQEYAKGRGIPEQRLVGLPLPNREIISREEFSKRLVTPLAQLFVNQGWFKTKVSMVKELVSGQQREMLAVQEQSVRVLVLMRGVPLKIQRVGDKPSPSKEDEASVDAELACLGLPVQGLIGGVPNPYYGKKQRFSQYGGPAGMLLVGRLDAPSTETVRRMMADSLAAEKNGLLGRAVIDLALKTGAYEEGENWLRRSAVSFRSHGIPVVVDRKADVLPAHWPLPDTALYFGWYTGDITGALADGRFRFVPGAVACHLHSFSASTLRTGEKHWCGPLLEHGAAATMGNVWEPYLSFTVHFDHFNDLLLEGYTLGEAAWAASPALSWMNVVVGDPLYRPYAVQSMGQERSRDYALYRGLVQRHAQTGNSAALKEDLLKLATTRKNGHLIELLALLADVESKGDEAVSLLEHAGSLYSQPQDQLRSLLYQAELLLREGNPAAQQRALALVDKATTEHQDQNSPDAPAHAEYQLLKGMRPPALLEKKP